MHKAFWNVLSILLALVIIVGGTFTSEWVGSQILPPEETVYENIQGNHGILRLENSQDLMLYPFDDYDPKTCVPIQESKFYQDAWGSAIDDTALKTIVETLNTYGGDLLPLDSRDSGELLNQETAPQILCNSTNEFCYIKDYKTSFGDFKASVDLAFQTNLDDEWYIPYLYCHVETTPTLDDTQRQETVERLTNWLDEYKSKIQENKNNSFRPTYSEDNPFPAVFGKLKDICSEKRNLSHKSHYLEDMLQNFECMVYRDEIYCIFTSGSDRIVLIYNPELRHFMGYSLYLP